MFGSEGESTGRYSFEIIAGQMRMKSHQHEVQKALNEGSNKGGLLNASLTGQSGGYSTGLFWDTATRR